VAFGVVTLALVARDIARDFDPDGPGIARTDRIVEEWAAVPAELREYLSSRTAARAGGRVAANPARALDVVAFGMHGRETAPDGRAVRWMSRARADVFIGADTRLVTIPLRHEIGAFREPARVRIVADGRIVAETTLTDGQWHPIDFSLKPRDASALRLMHHVAIELDHAWIPAHVIPGSGDFRLLGLQVGTIALR
jgi:hypothetical protein